MITNKKNKKVLITGSTGFIGSALRKKLSGLDYEVMGIGREKKEDLKIDLSDPSLTDFVKKISPEIIFHLASGSNIARAEENKDKEYRDTVISTQTLINLLKLNDLSKTFFIYLSSQAVYGPQKIVPVNENQTPNPITTYGKNKLKAEEIITSSNFNYLIFRISSAFGPLQDYRKSGVIAKFINKMKNNESPIVFNSFDVITDLIYIDDIISALLIALEKINSGVLLKEIFNLGSGEPKSVKDILNILYQFFPDTPKPKLELTNLYPGHEKKGIYLDTSKIKKVLNWSPKYSLETALTKMLNEECIFQKA